jgi:exosortase
MTSAAVPRPSLPRPTLPPALLWLAIPLAGLAWAFATTFQELAHAWQSNAQYSHGWLVPVFSAWLLWARRDRLGNGVLRPSLVCGGLLLAAGLASRLSGAFFHYGWLDEIALLPCLAGVILLVGGWRALGWSWPAIAFLAFMVPLPYRVATALAGPLQQFATLGSTFLMQVIGVPALAEGNVILLEKGEIGVVEACSGLRMLVVFFALTTAVALVVRRPLLERLIVLVSAVPIALVVNLLRITATGILHEWVDSKTANAFFHDAAGWFMMPLALVFLWLELWVLSRLFLEPPAAPSGRVTAGPRPRGQLRPGAARPRRAARPTSAAPAPDKSLPAPASAAEPR